MVIFLVQLFSFKLIVDSHAVVRNSRDPVYPLPVFPNGNIL